ncbi:MAG: hypothetical protein KIT85_07440 [Pseudolabrys sp.]|nr:hypothetical protein [Pseudolabrys sp.]
MKKLPAIAVIFILVQQAASAQEGVGTPFRGVAVNMLKADIEKVTLPDLKAVAEGSAVKFVGKNDRKCGSVTFDADQKADFLNFDRCYFAADDLSMQEFAQQFVNQYDIPNLSCKVESQYAPMMRITIKSKTCSGPSSKGELVTITETTSPGFADEVEVEIKRRSQKPKFN